MPNNEHPLRCVILIRGQRTQQGVWPFLHGMEPDPTKPIKLKGAFFTLCATLCFVVASAAEAELGALFLNCKQATIFRPTLEEMGYPQPLTPIHCENSTAVGIANNTVKRQGSR